MLDVNAVNVEIVWEYTGAGEQTLEFSRVLYAYLHPETSRLLYIGKADYCTVRERLYGKHKEAIFEEMQDDLGIREFHAIVGVLGLARGRRFSSALLADVESLLIFKIQPPYNRHLRKSRISRPGLTVRCGGSWPHARKRFIDD